MELCSLEIDIKSANQGLIHIQSDYQKLAFVCHCLQRVGCETGVNYLKQINTNLPMSYYIKYIEYDGFGKNPKFILVNKESFKVQGEDVQNSFIEIESSSTIAEIRRTRGIYLEASVGTILMLYTRFFYINDVVAQLARQGSIPFMQYAQENGIDY